MRLGAALLKRGGLSYGGVGFDMEPEMKARDEAMLSTDTRRVEGVRASVFVCAGGVGCVCAAARDENNRVTCKGVCLRIMCSLV